MIKRIIYPIFFILLILVLWESFVKIAGIPEYIVPPPSEIFIVLRVKLWMLLYHSGITLTEALLGFALGNITAFFLAIIIIHSKLCEYFIYPIIIGLYATPTIALAPLILMWFGVGIVSKAIISGLICFFPIVINLTRGLISIEKEQKELLEIYHANKIETLFKVRIPTALPFFFSALKIAVTLSVVGAVVAEFMGAEAGLGYVIIKNQAYFDIKTIFACLIFLSVIGVGLFVAVRIIEYKLLYWNNKV
jgi:ABC-type nitrate/sulfonate/bicarbonate transport system permease component